MKSFLMSLLARLSRVSAVGEEITPSVCEYPVDVYPVRLYLVCARCDIPMNCVGKVDDHWEYACPSCNTHHIAPKLYPYIRYQEQH